MGNGALCACERNRPFLSERIFLESCGIDARHCNVAKWRPQQVLRLRRIMAGDATLSNRKFDGSIVHEVGFDETFEAFVGDHSAWKINDTNFKDVAIFFHRYPHVPNLKVLRRQMSGLCFMHAPVVLQHVMVGIFCGKDYKFEMLDVASYIRSSWRGEAMLQYLLFDNGGSSLAFMREINRHVNLKLCSYVIPDLSSQLFKVVCEEIMSRLRHRPALVSNFHIDETFMRGGVSFLEGNVDHHALKGMHAMMLIGCRKNAQGEFVFLMQNWWNNRYFIEVSAAYLESARSTITFIDNDIPYIPESFPVVFDLYAETSIDICERMNEL